MMNQVSKKEISPGDKIGRRTIQGDFILNSRNERKWLCRCDCGNEVLTPLTQLTQGFKKSCGCLSHPPLKELIGKRFGQLTVIEYAGMYKENLKLVDGTSVAILEANKNRLIASNTSGYTGVYQNKKNGKWMAQITFKKKTYYLGSYDKIEDAIKARQRGEEMHDDFLEWYYQRHGNHQKESE